MKNLHTPYRLNWIERSFIRSFPKRIEELDSAATLQAKQLFITLFNEESQYISDRQSQTHFVMCAYVLAIYKTLIRKGITKEKSIQVLTKHLSEFGSGTIKWSMRIALWLRLYNRKTVESNSLKNVEHRYGDTFDVGEEKGIDQYVMVIKKCGFNDFFKRQSAPELTKIFCEWDHLWANEINRNKSCGIQFLRPTTLAEGKAACRFEFHFQK